MTTLLLERSPVLEEGFERDMRRRLDGALVSGRTDVHGRLTLDDLITSVWEGLAVRETVGCPVCASPMTSSSPTSCGALPTGACLGCGSRLS
jgi:hypothetical protein